MTYQNIQDGGIGHSTIVSDAFLFFHGNTVSEEVQASDQWKRVVELKRAFINLVNGRLMTNKITKAKREQLNRPGAPVGNDNAARKDGRPRVQINVRVEQVTLDWLQGQADQATNGNVGRLLDEIVQQETE